MINICQKTTGFSQFILFYIFKRFIRLKSLSLCYKITIMESKNIHVLHTDKPSILFYLNSALRLEFNTVERKTNQHIYITNEEEINEGDWCLLDQNVGTSVGYEILKCEESDTENGWYVFGEMKTGRCKKIILTTDLDLIKDGVQYIDDDFLEWFLNNQRCEKVEIHIIKCVYKIIIPIEEPKQLEKRMYSDEDMRQAWEDGRNGETECIGSYPFYKTMFKNKTFSDWFKIKLTMRT